MSRAKRMLDMALKESGNNPELDFCEVLPSTDSEDTAVQELRSLCITTDLAEFSESSKSAANSFTLQQDKPDLADDQVVISQAGPSSRMEEPSKSTKKNLRKLNEQSYSENYSDSDIDFSPDQSEYVPSDEDSDSNDADQGPVLENCNLEGMEEHPETTEKPRKRKRQPEEWKSNAKKIRRAHGEEYIGAQGIIKPKVEMRLPCGPSCKQKCNIAHEKRKDIFNSYWAMGNYTRQRDFINSNTDKTETKTKTTRGTSRREFSCSFYLPCDGAKIKVCKTMFLNTLGIKKGVVDIALKKRSNSNTSLGDGRGQHTKKVLPPDIKQGVKAHIESVPVVPSHYCRSDTERKYLQSDFNIRVMYQLYIKWCEDKNIPKAKESFYRYIFSNDYNLGFHRPKKDQCRICSAFEKGESIPEYEHHIMKKDIAKKEKIKDKEEAAGSDKKIVSVNFDLQQVLLTPTDPTNNALFYKRRLTSYNFTVYNVISKEGECFMWHECEGGRGSSEIASCLFHYFQSQSGNVEEIRCFSDRCGGQNLNQFVAGMCMYSVTTLNIKSIDLKFLTSGHSEMECDSIHSAIGTEFKRVGKAYWPGDWKTIARSARRKGDKPYRVIENIAFKDWKNFVQTNFNIRKKDTDGQPVQWQKMSWIRFEESLPNCFKFKENFDDEEFRVVDCSITKRRSSSNLLQPLYKTPKAISKKKYDDLMSLFSSTPPAMSRDYYNFYANLPYSLTKEDDE